MTAPPQSGQLHKESALVLIGFCRGVDDVAADCAEALRAFTTACAARVRRRVIGVDAK